MDEKILLEMLGDHTARYNQLLESGDDESTEFRSRKKMIDQIKEELTRRKEAKKLQQKKQAS